MMPDIGYTIRPAREDEIDVILALFIEEVRAGRMLPRDPQEIRGRIGDWLVSEEDGQLTGCVSLVFFNRELCELRSLAVHPGKRGNGLGRALIKAAVAMAGERGMARVLTLTRAAPVFERLGFREDMVGNFPEKVWKDCAPCPLKERCDEIALVYHLEESAI
jgi:amino-acid N-acetyltransferase